MAQSPCSSKPEMVVNAVDVPLQGSLLLSGGRALPPLVQGIAVVTVFSLQNAWNAVTFLNASADVNAAKDLFNVGEPEIGVLTTLGLLGVVCTMPIATVCKWPRTLLWLGSAANLIAPILRWYAAQIGSYNLFLVSFIITGSAWGVIGIWPAMLSAAFFQVERQALVTALALLSNWFGGALAAVLIPAWTQGSGDGLLSFLQMQVYVCVGLGVSLICFVWIPDIHGGATMSLSSEFQVCIKFPVATQIISFGMLISVAVALQNVNPMLLVGIGFSEVKAGIGNCGFQIAGALVGVVVGMSVTRRSYLRKTLYCLHMLSLFSCMAMFVLTWVTVQRGLNDAIVAAFLAAMTLQGGAVVGLMPFMIQEVVYAAHPVSENFAAGLVTSLGTVLGAGLNQIMAGISTMRGVAFVLSIVSFEFVFFAWHYRRYQPPDSTHTATISFSGSCRVP